MKEITKMNNEMKILLETIQKVDALSFDVKVNTRGLFE